MHQRIIGQLQVQSAALSPRRPQVGHVVHKRVTAHRDDIAGRDVNGAAKGVAAYGRCAAGIAVKVIPGYRHVIRAIDIDRAAEQL